MLGSAVLWGAALGDGGADMKARGLVNLLLDIFPKNPISSDFVGLFLAFELLTASCNAAYSALKMAKEGQGRSCGKRRERGRILAEHVVCEAVYLREFIFVIYDNAKAPVRLDRTSTYQRAFGPMAVYYNGRLYTMGYSPAETHVAYFRATDLWDAGTVTKKATCTAAGKRTYKCLYRTASYTEAIPALGHAWDAGKVTKKAAAGVAGKRKHTCKTCGATKTVAIKALLGGAKGKSYKVAGNTYKVVSNGKSTAKSTVMLTKAKSAKTVAVPATVKIKGKTYKVTSIGAKAFAKAKAKLVTVTVGKNVMTVGKQAFAGCAKLEKAKGGTAVTTIGASAFSGCAMLASCAPLSSNNLKKIGATALKGAKKLTKATLKSKKLKKAAVKNSLKGSSVKTITVKLGSSKANKTYAKKYKGLFAKKNSGKKAKLLAPVTKNQAV